MGAPELLLAYQTMDAAVVVANALRVASQPVLFHPVDFKVAKGPAIPAPDDGETVLGLKIGREEGVGVLLRSGLAPEIGHTRVVHPFVEVIGVGQAEIEM